MSVNLLGPPTSVHVMNKHYLSALVALVAGIALAGCDNSPQPPDPERMPAPEVSLAEAISASETNSDTARCADAVFDDYIDYRAIPETCQGAPTSRSGGLQGQVDLDIAQLRQILGGASGFDETHYVSVTAQGLPYVAWQDVATTCTNTCRDTQMHVALVEVSSSLTAGAPIFLGFETPASNGSATEFRAAIEAMEVK